jgi:hypothetical protein
MIGCQKSSMSKQKKRKINEEIMVVHEVDKERETTAATRGCDGSFIKEIVYSQLNINRFFLLWIFFFQNE